MRGSTSRPKVGRKILCDKCSRVFQGAGQTRVMRKVVFHFCPPCWADRRACEIYMDRISAPAKAAGVAA